jgi:hypothetical protein
VGLRPDNSNISDIDRGSYRDMLQQIADRFRGE